MSEQAGTIIRAWYLLALLYHTMSIIANENAHARTGAVCHVDRERSYRLISRRSNVELPTA